MRIINNNDNNIRNKALSKIGLVVIIVVFFGVSKIIAIAIGLMVGYIFLLDSRERNAIADVIPQESIASEILSEHYKPKPRPKVINNVPSSGKRKITKNIMIDPENPSDVSFLYNYMCCRKRNMLDKSFNDNIMINVTNINPNVYRDMNHKEYNDGIVLVDILVRSRVCPSYVKKLVDFSIRED